MNFIIKLVMFAIMLNISTGIVFNLFPDTFTDSGLGGLQYTEDYTSNFADNMNTSINPTDQMEDRSDLFDRLLDKLTIGIWSKFLEGISQYFYGFVTILNNTFGKYINDDLRIMFFGQNGSFGGLGALLTVGYVYFAIYLWTGRDLRI